MHLGQNLPFTDPDADLVWRAKRGDAGAFEELVRRHERRVFSALVAITGNREDAEDGAQNSFLKAFEHIGGFRARAGFPPG